VTVVGAERDEAVRLPLLRECGFATRTEAPAEPVGAWIEASGAVAALASAVGGLRAGGDLTALDLLCGAAAVPADRMVSPFPLDDWAAALDAVTRGTVFKAALRP
jgi:hypothetical protein